MNNDQISTSEFSQKENDNTLWDKENFTLELESFLTSMEKNSQMVSFCLKPDSRSKNSSFKGEERQLKFSHVSKPRQNSISKNQFKNRRNKMHGTSDRDISTNWRDKYRFRKSRDYSKDNKNVTDNEHSISNMKSFLLENKNSKINTVENIEKGKKINKIFRR